MKKMYIDPYTQDKLTLILTTPIELPYSFYTTTTEYCDCSIEYNESIFYYFESYKNSLSEGTKKNYYSDSEIQDKITQIVNLFCDESEEDFYASRVVLFYRSWRNESWILNIRDQDWVSHDGWGMNNDETKIQQFSKQSKNCYSLFGGISDACACEGGITTGMMCCGPEFMLFYHFIGSRDCRTDLRGYDTYQLYSRKYIGCWSFASLEYHLSKNGYSCEILFQ